MAAAKTATAPTLEAPASPAATGHQKHRIREPALEKSFQDLLDLPTDLGDDLHAQRANRHLQWPGDRPANENVYREPGEFLGPVRRMNGGQGDFLAPDFASVGHVDQQ